MGLVQMCGICAYAILRVVDWIPIMAVSVPSSLKMFRGIHYMRWK